MGQKQEPPMKAQVAISLCVMLTGPAFFAGSALAESVGEKTGINAAIGISPSTPDFIKEAAVSDMFEVQSSELAQQKATDQATKDFAAHMIKDHSKTTSDLTSLVQSGKVKADIPAKLDSAHQSMLDKLKSLNGADFTKQYRSDQESGHKDAVSLFKRYSDGGDNPELKAWAAETLPTLEDHLKMVQGLNQTKAEKTPVSND
jgi:putative membrane protein